MCLCACVGNIALGVGVGDELRSAEWGVGWIGMKEAVSTRSDGMDEEESGGMMDEDSSKERSEEGREENDQGKTGRYC